VRANAVVGTISHSLSNRQTEPFSSIGAEQAFKNQRKLERFILPLEVLNPDLLADHSVRWDVVPQKMGLNRKTVKTQQTHNGENQKWHTNT